MTAAGRRREGEGMGSGARGAGDLCGGVVTRVACGAALRWSSVRRRLYVSRRAAPPACPLAPTARLAHAALRLHCTVHTAQFSVHRTAHRAYHIVRCTRHDLASDCEVVNCAIVHS